ncbi:iron-containing alcohol dehydrogenase, partial [bacterium]|nr:iron-containing alcohol dehydrogenase [bacterium]
NPTKVIYGIGMASDLKPELDSLFAQKYFIVSDEVINNLGLVKKVADGLISAGIKITGEYLDVPQDAELSAIKNCSDRAKASGADGLIAVGGGSVMDTAKAANILISEGGDLIEDYSGAHTLSRPLKPLVAIPTTAGTGSEVTMISMVYDKESHVKSPFTDKFLLPNIAVLDPEMTLSMPPKLTASTGMDALTHAIEAYVGVQWSPPADGLAVKAVELIFNNIEKAVKTGDDIEARGAMLIASNLAGIAFTHSMCGCVHGMAHSLGGLYRVPHGIANGILLPHGLEYNFDVIKDKLARLLSVIDQEKSGIDIEDTARKTIKGIKNLLEKLNSACGLPVRLRDAGVPEEGLPDAAEGTVMDGTSFYNPREVVAEEILKHLKNAY